MVAEAIEKRSQGLSEIGTELNWDLQQRAVRIQTRKLWGIRACFVQQQLFFFQQRHKPDLLCPGVYPKLMVVFAASGGLRAILSSWNSLLCKWAGTNVHRVLGILKHGSSLTIWSLSISSCGTTSSAAVGWWSDCLSTQVAANAALKETYSHCLPWSLQLFLPNKKVQI